jgi:hypothetical protein
MLPRRGLKSGIMAPTFSGSAIGVAVLQKLKQGAERL